MRFLMLMIPAVYQPGAPDPEKVIQTMDPEKVARMMKLNEDLHAAGALIALDGLHPLSKGARVSYRGGKPVVTDGPFAEAKEQLAGFLLLDCQSAERAVEIAARVPEAELGRVEVRPVQQLGGTEI